MKIHKWIFVLVYTIGKNGAYSADKKTELPRDMMAAVCDSEPNSRDLNCNDCPLYIREVSSKTCENCKQTMNFQFKGSRYLHDYHVKGHFSGPKIQEVLVSMNGCFDHAHGFASAVLLQMDHGRWKRVQVFTENLGDTFSCELLTPTELGRDLMLCSKFSGWGDSNHTDLEVYELTQELQLKKFATLLRFGSNEGTPPEAQKTKNGCVQISKEKIVIEGTHITVKLQIRHISMVDISKVEAITKGKKNFQFNLCQDFLEKSKPERVILEFSFLNGSFSPDQKSQKIVDQINALRN